jgi:hypothetical protein
MVAQVKPTKKNSPAVKVGKNADNLPADSYAKPHTVSGKPVGNELPAMSVESGKDYMNRMNISVGGVSKGNYPATKTDGVETRGNGAATKGRTARGPMA